MSTLQVCLWYAWIGAVVAAMLWRSVWNSDAFTDEERQVYPPSIRALFATAFALTWPIQIVAFLFGVLGVFLIPRR